MKTAIMKWGNSLAVRIPKALAKLMGVDKETEVEMRFENDSIILKKASPKLSDLLSQINENNIHEEIDWVEPVGKEIW